MNFYMKEKRIDERKNIMRMTKIILEEREQLEQVIARAKEVISDKLTGNIVKEIYVPGRIVNIVMK